MRERGTSEGDEGVRQRARRRFLLAAAGVFASPALAARGTEPTNAEGKKMTKGRGAGDAKTARVGRVRSRPSAVKEAAPKGLVRTLTVEGGRDALLYVPASYRPDAPAPLALMLHGAGGTAAQGLGLVRDFADAANLILLAPQSLGPSWDAIRGDFGPDVLAIDRALEQTFTLYSIDPARLAVGGFSDGASYALSLGLTNGDLFTHVLAFSPGFAKPGNALGRPHLFFSHGTRDRVLPVERCSRVLVEQARAGGYRVRYREFDGTHTVPALIAGEAVKWFLKT